MTKTVKKSSSFFIAESIARNIAAFFLRTVMRRHGSLGMEGEINFVTDTLYRLSRLCKNHIKVNNKIVVELGPGRTPHLMVAFAFAGAKEVIGVDIYDRLLSDWNKVENFLLLKEKLCEVNNAFCKAFSVDVHQIEKTYSKIYQSGKLPVEFQKFSGHSLPVDNDSVGLIYSKSVLEHIHIDIVADAMRDELRVLEKGGYAAHIIDLRDHTKLLDDEKVQGNWLEALEYSESLHLLMTSRRNVYINRLRASEWKSLFTSAGFEIVEWKEQHLPLPSDFAVQKLNQKHKQLVNEDFSISYLDVLIRKPS